MDNEQNISKVIVNDLINNNLSEYKCKNVQEYLDKISSIKEEWNDSTVYWFRGHSDHNFKLIPSIYRNCVWDYNSDLSSNICNEFINKAKQQFRFSNTAGFWEWYHIMQHYGLPTRLLDWTEGSLIGLFFSVRDTKVEDNACVWMLDPFDLNLKVTKGEGVFYTDKITQGVDDVLIEEYKNGFKELPKLPVALYPPYIDERMRAQKSCFTIHGSVVDGFDDIMIQHKDIKLSKIIIDKEFIFEIKSELFSMGITEGTLFPDLEGLAKELKFAYSMK